MYSRDHAILSLVVGGLAIALVDLPFGWPSALVVAVVAGVGIDLDHFLIARVTTGEWRAVRRCLADPRLVFLDQDEIFQPGAIWPLQRLLSHAVIIALAVPGLWFVDVGLALFLGAVLYTHLLADLVWDNYQHDEYRRRHVEYARGSDGE